MGQSFQDLNICSMYHEGNSLRTIAEYYEVSLAYVKRVLERNNIPIRRGPPSRSGGE